MKNIKNFNHDNIDYKFYVYNTQTGQLYSGWEYKEDAQDHIDEIKDEYRIMKEEEGDRLILDPKMMNGFKIYTRKYVLNNLCMDLNDHDSWFIDYDTKSLCFHPNQPITDPLKETTKLITLKLSDDEFKFLDDNKFIEKIQYVNGYNSKVWVDIAVENVDKFKKFLKSYTINFTNCQELINYNIANSILTKLNK